MQYCTDPPLNPAALIQLTVSRTADLAGVVPNADRVLAHRKKCHTVLPIAEGRERGRKQGTPRGADRVGLASEAALHGKARSTSRNLAFRVSQ